MIDDQSTTGLNFDLSATLNVKNGGAIQSQHVGIGAAGTPNGASVNVLDGGTFTSALTELWAITIITIDGGVADFGTYSNVGAILNFNRGTVTIGTGTSGGDRGGGETYFNGATAYVGPYAAQEGLFNVEAGTVNGDTFTLGGGVFGATANFDGGTASFTSTTLEADGVINVNDGVAYLGTFTNNSGAVNFTSGLLSFNADLSVGPGGLLGAALSLNADRQLEVGGTTTIDSFHTLTLDGGSLSTGVLVNNGTFDFQRGRLAITGGLAIGA